MGDGFVVILAAGGAGVLAAAVMERLAAQDLRSSSRLLELIWRYCRAIIYKR